MEAADRSAEEDPPRTAGLGLRDEAGGAGGCRSLRGCPGEQAVAPAEWTWEPRCCLLAPMPATLRTARITLPRPVSSAGGGPPSSELGGGEWEGFSPEPNCLGNFITVLGERPAACSPQGKGRGGRAGGSRRGGSREEGKARPEVARDGGQPRGRRGGLADEFHIRFAGKIPGWESRQEKPEDSVGGRQLEAHHS